MQSKSLPNRFVGVCAFAALALASGWAQAKGIPQKAEKDELVHMQDRNPAMQKAFRQARATLDDFLAKAAHPQPDTGAYAVKVGIRQNGNTEYFWIADFVQTPPTAGADSQAPIQFTGRINNEPRMVTTVTKGQAYAFSKSEIVDWMYMQPGPVMHGNFTACALLSKSPKSEKIAMQRQYGLRCE